MAPTLTAADLRARLKQTEEDAKALKDYWEGSLPFDLCPPPPDFELKNAVRRLPLAYLATGIEQYVAKINSKSDAAAAGKKVSLPVSTRNALAYVCGTAWKIREGENPGEQFHPTARRQRNASRDPDSSQWDGEAFHNATPEERQKIIGENMARQKAKRVQ